MFDFGDDGLYGVGYERQIDEDQCDQDVLFGIGDFVVCGFGQIVKDVVWGVKCGQCDVGNCCWQCEGQIDDGIDEVVVGKVIVCQYLCQQCVENQIEYCRKEGQLKGQEQC